MTGNQRIKEIILRKQTLSKQTISAIIFTWQRRDYCNLNNDNYEVCKKQLTLDSFLLEYLVNVLNPCSFPKAI